MINGQLVNTDLQSWLHKDITPLIDIARQRAEKPYIAVDTLEIAGQPALIAAAALTPERIRVSNGLLAPFRVGIYQYPDTG